MAPKNKTRERIIEASLALFNAQGERNVTTNHLAAHLGISPGNLYYHFRNKQAIIAELFAQYAERVDMFLRLPQGRAMTVDDKTFYLEALLASMWHYRFLHRDLEHLLESDAELAGHYRKFALHCLESGQRVYQGFVDAGILAMTPAQLEALALNSWIILTSWVRFLCTIRSDANDLSEEHMRRGIYQVLALEQGHLSEQAREAVEALNRKLHVPLERII
ncbi:TetR/AcrR family transcriptional regulator [Pseudomonas sp. Marseille-Q8238]